MLTHDGNALLVRAQKYQLTFPSDSPFVLLDDTHGERIAELAYLSSIHPLHGHDDTTSFGIWEAHETGDHVVLTLTATSAVWLKKTYRFRCSPERFTYEIEVQGQGDLADVLYFGGNCSARETWGTGFFWSKQRFLRGFTPEPNTDERAYFPPQGSATIDLMGSFIAGRGDWFFTPPPFCFAFETPSGWISLGVEAAPGQNRFSEYSYRAQTGFYLALTYDGQTAVNGNYRLPAIGFDFAADEYSALTAHVEALHAENYAPRVQRSKMAWWSEPIFCGWGAQCAIGRREQQPSALFARQDIYTGFVRVLQEHGLNPGTITIDWKWQRDFGDYRADEEKWPDLPGFIAEQHGQGRRVLLWMKAWDTEGVPIEECITNAAGIPVTCDPTNPAYERRLRAAVRHMLAPEGYDADGFKIDFTAQIAAGPGLKKYGDAWGLELMRRYLEIIYTEAKATKPEALVVTHTPHPYLADVLDMVRLNDVVVSADINAAMTYRARIARIACPDALIDTDNWPFPDKATWQAYIALQPTLGVPALYNVTHLDRTGEPLDEADYMLIRETWARYRAALDADR